MSSQISDVRCRVRMDFTWGDTTKNWTEFFIICLIYCSPFFLLLYYDFLVHSLKNNSWVYMFCRHVNFGSICSLICYLLRWKYQIAHGTLFLATRSNDSIKNQRENCKSYWCGFCVVELSRKPSTRSRYVLFPNWYRRFPRDWPWFIACIAGNMNRIARFRYQIIIIY